MSDDSEIQNIKATQYWHIDVRFVVVVVAAERARNKSMGGIQLEFKSETF